MAIRLDRVCRRGRAPSGPGPNRRFADAGGLRPAGDTCYAICLAPPGPSVTQPEERSCSTACFAGGTRAEPARARRPPRHPSLNVFQTAPGQPIVLGAPGPRRRQYRSRYFIQPHSAMCLPSGRGDGGIAVTIYRSACSMCSDKHHRWRNKRGCDPSPQAGTGDLCRAGGHERRRSSTGPRMLAGTRTSSDPTLLRDPASAWACVAARPPRRAQRPITLGSGGPGTRGRWPCPGDRA
jgi:hypothetical protein